MSVLISSARFLVLFGVAAASLTSFKSDVQSLRRDVNRNCVGLPMNQGMCGSCYAFALASSFADRICDSRGTYEHISPQNLISCNRWGKEDSVRDCAIAKFKRGKGRYPYANALKACQTIHWKRARYWGQTRTIAACRGDYVHLNPQKSVGWGGLLFTCDGDYCSSGCQPYVDGTADGSPITGHIPTCQKFSDDNGEGNGFTVYDDLAPAGDPCDNNRPSTNSFGTCYVGGNTKRAMRDESLSRKETFSTAMDESSTVPSDKRQDCVKAGFVIQVPGELPSDEKSGIDVTIANMGSLGDVEGFYKDAIETRGSIPVLVNVRKKEWESFWIGDWSDMSTHILTATSSNRNYDWKYDNSSNHAVRIVGFGSYRGTDYWLCANSWGHGWGDSGFFRVERGHNILAIESQASVYLAMTMHKWFNPSNMNVLERSSWSAHGRRATSTIVDERNKTDTNSGDNQAHGTTIVGRVGHMVPLPSHELMDPTQPHHGMVEQALQPDTFHRRIPARAALNLTRTPLTYEKGHIEGSSQPDNTCRLDRGNVQVVAGLRFRLTLNCTAAENPCVICQERQAGGENVACPMCDKSTPPSLVREFHQIVVDTILEPTRRHSGSKVPGGAALLGLQQLALNNSTDA